MHGRWLRVSLLLIATLMVGVVVAQLTGHDRVVTGVTRLANALFVALAPVAVVIGVRRSLRRNLAVTIEVVLGALCLYLLVGLFFAFLYGAVNNLGGSPFFASGAGINHRT